MKISIKLLKGQMDYKDKIYILAASGLRKSIKS